LIQPDEDQLADAAGFVLAGGKSGRMGSDKALVQLGGRPLVAHALDILRLAGVPGAICGSASPIGEDATVIQDTEPGRGPLGGVCAALQFTTARHAVFLSVDSPFIPASLILYLLDHARITGAAVTLPSVAGHAQTFPAVVVRAVLGRLKFALDSGVGGCFAAFQKAAKESGSGFSVLPVESLVQPGQVAHPDHLPPAFWFLNLNTRDDLGKAESLLAGYRVI